MTKKFNPKQYQKDRIYIEVPGAPRISRLLIWNKSNLEYTPPKRGKSFRARKYVTDANGNNRRTEEFFHSLQEARNWQLAALGSQILAPQNQIAIQNKGTLMRDLILEWKKRIFPGLALGTRVEYERVIKNHFQSLLNLGVYEITPQRIDLWLDELKDPSGTRIHSSRRKNFRHEIKVLSIIFKYYEEYYDDKSFEYPVKKRHRKAAMAVKPVHIPSKDLTVEEFFLFRNALLKLKNGAFFAILATVQYFQALRISEAAAIHFDDLVIDRSDPKNSRLHIRRSVIWPRRKDLKSFVKLGFKNSKSNDGVKEQPMFPQAYEALIQLYDENKRGLVFQVNGQHLEYRRIQYMYDTAFKKAGLPYRATHVMRHGGCRDLYNRVPDPDVAKQLLGNSNLQTTMIYAKRKASALTEVVSKEWENFKAGGCNWVQIQHPTEQGEQL